MHHPLGEPLSLGVSREGHGEPDLQETKTQQTQKTSQASTQSCSRLQVRRDAGECWEATSHLLTLAPGKDMSLNPTCLV